MITKTDIKKDFDRYTAGKYVYFDCSIHQDRVEIKCIEWGKNFTPMIMTVPVVSEDVVAWADQKIRRYNPGKDW